MQERMSESCPSRGHRLFVDYHSRMHVEGAVLTYRDLRTFQERNDLGRHAVDILKFALPDYERLPALRFEHLKRVPITRLVSPELFRPELPVGRGDGGALAIVAVPETSVDKDDFTPRNEGQVRLAGQVFAVQAEAIPEPVHQTAHLHLRRCVLAANRPHVGAAVHT
jgi:hypothetical protein